jgi:hydrogenase maturation protein HypF
MTIHAATDDPVRHRIRVVGVVQGVGFRPFVHRLATELSLAGNVGNDTEGVLVEVEGKAPVIARFEERLLEEAPPLARIYGLEASPVAARGETGFAIIESRTDRAGQAGRTFVSPDVAVCTDCLDELFDPSDRRYRYPFINCTNCGPRFTITISLPYDRPNTTMRAFALCPQCASEYDDPADRRFHAQPVACADCGPRISFEDADGRVEGTDAALAAAQKALTAGAIVALKGLGGYHLACDAYSPAALARLRRRKQRPDKPFAVMARDLAAARTLASIDDREAALLASPARPIVLLRGATTAATASRGGSALPPEVAPGNPYIGVLLPYTPLHHLLFHAVPGGGSPVPEVLVMTSGNLSEEPICYDDADARNRLGRIADAWLVHDRPIHVPCDDSVVRVEDGAEMAIRRSRGYAPLPVRLPFESPPLLAVGGELKNAFCLAAGREAWMSQHIGDMGSLETLAAFEHSTRQFGEIYEVRPQLVAADAHPGYQTRRWAERSERSERAERVEEAERGDRIGRPVELVQHHHAHIAAVMAEHGLARSERVIGYAFDGTGYGTDGAIWGGEVLVAGYADFERHAHLRYVPLPGGDAAVRKPYRAALAHLWAAGIEWAPGLRPVQAAGAAELTVIERQLQRDFQCVPTSSMGRLFDAVSSLLGLRHTVSFEAQAAIELEETAAAYPGTPADYRFVRRGDDIDPAPVLRAIVSDLSRDCPAGAIAAGFHQAVARLVVETAVELRETTGIDRVALSGGVFQNVLLVRLARAALSGRGLRVLTHIVVPPNDGGLALGQAAIAASRAPVGADEWAWRERTPAEA